MPVEFSEYRCKRKYKSGSHKFPLFRLILLGLAFLLAYRLGFFSMVVDLLPLPGSAEMNDKPSWKVACEKYSGKAFELDGNLGQCSWIVRDSMAELPNSFLRYVASLRKGAASSIHWVAPIGDFSKALFVLHEDSISSAYLHIPAADSSMIWIDASTGCRFPGLCPKQPLGWSSLSISDDFDFSGQEALLAMDKLRGIGEAPVRPILSGKVLASGKDSLGYYVELDHGYNVTSKMSGLFRYDKDSVSFEPGSWVDLQTLVGRIAPRDSSAIYLTIRRNGHFVRWNDFFAESHPVDSAKISKFKEQIGL
jgi:hypothetical protein